MSFIGDFFGRIFGSSSYRKKLLNPVLNDPKDVTPKVIEKILNNSLESITINYNMKLINEFKFDDEEFNSRTLHFFSPFSIAELNNKTGAHVEAISYPIIFGEKVTNISGLFNKFPSSQEKAFSPVLTGNTPVSFCQYNIVLPSAAHKK